MTKSIDEHEGKKYLREIRDILDPVQIAYVDVYAVLVAFEVTCPARAQAIKKLLCCGNRGKGDELDDLKGAEAAIYRAIELEQNRRWNEDPPTTEPTPCVEDIIQQPEQKIRSVRDLNPGPSWQVPPIIKEEGGSQ